MTISTAVLLGMIIGLLGRIAFDLMDIKLRLKNILILLDEEEKEI